MILEENGHRYKIYSNYGRELNRPYDYERQGLVQHIFASKIANTKSPVLRPMLDFVEKSLIFLLKNVDYLKHFKDICWKNR